MRAGEGGVSEVQGTGPRRARQAVVETLAAVLSEQGAARQGRDWVRLVF